MTESYLYDLIKAILEQSTTIQGRFFVAEGYGNDLNTGNFDNIIKDALSNIKPGGKKYPLSIMMPPVEQEGAAAGWSTFQVKIFFLNLAYQDENGIKNQNLENNTSETQIFEDWEAMRTCAGDFREAFNQTVRYSNLLGSIRNSQNSLAVYERYSKMNNDGCNGVSIAFDIQLFRGCVISDYPSNYLSLIDLPE